MASGEAGDGMRRLANIASVVRERIDQVSQLIDNVKKDLEAVSSDDDRSAAEQKDSLAQNALMLQTLLTSTAELFQETARRLTVEGPIEQEESAEGAPDETDNGGEAESGSEPAELGESITFEELMNEHAGDAVLSPPEADDAGESPISAATSKAQAPVARNADNDSTAPVANEAAHEACVDGLATCVVQLGQRVDEPGERERLLLRLHEAAASSSSSDDDDDTVPPTPPRRHALFASSSRRNSSAIRSQPVVGVDDVSQLLRSGAALLSDSMTSSKDVSKASVMGKAAVSASSADSPVTASGDEEVESTAEGVNELAAAVAERLDAELADGDSVEVCDAVRPPSDDFAAAADGHRSDAAVSKRLDKATRSAGDTRERGVSTASPAPRESANSDGRRSGDGKRRPAAVRQTDDADVVTLSGDESDDTANVNRLLRQPISESSSDSESGRQGAAEARNTTKAAAAKTKKKRLRIESSSSAGDDDSDAEIDDCSDASSVVPVAPPAKAKKTVRKGRRATRSSAAAAPQRKKARRAAVASDDDDSDVAIIEDNEADSQGSSQAGRRKELRKVMDPSKLRKETIDAEKDEKQRRKRLQEMQKDWNGVLLEEHESQLPDGSPRKNKAVLQVVLTPPGKYRVEVHPKIVKHLKQHQAAGIAFLFQNVFETVEDFEDGFAGGAILAHCMGLGKTLQVVALLHTVMTEKRFAAVIKRVLVLVPKSVVRNWCLEFEKWLCDDELSTIAVHELSTSESVKERYTTLREWLNGGGVLITNYEMYVGMVEQAMAVLKPDELELLLNHKRRGNRGGAKMKARKVDKRIRADWHRDCFEALCDPGPEIVVCDEAHALKNDMTKRVQLVSQVKTKRRICLTGTPLQNNLTEYYFMVNFVKPQLLGSLDEFKNRFENPITNGQHQDSKAIDVRLMKLRSHVLCKTLDKVVMRRDYRTFEGALPPKQEYVINVRLTECQEELYRYYLDNVVFKNGQDLDNEEVVQTLRRRMVMSDFWVFNRICAHPYNLITHEEVQRLKQQQKEDEAFVTDASSSEESNAEEDEIVLGSDKDDAPTTGDGEEVVQPWKSRTRGGADKAAASGDAPSTSGGDGRDTPPEVRGWFGAAARVTPNDRNRVELSAKLGLLLEIIKKCEKIGDKLLVFSQSVESLDMIENALKWLSETRAWQTEARESLAPAARGGDGEGRAWGWVYGADYYRIDGSVSCLDKRQRMIDAFNDADDLQARLFLISTRAGSLGINMTAANRVVIFDACWNPTHDTQSLFRVYRFGQEKPVYIYRLIAMWTMEERIYDRQVTKTALSLRVCDEKQIQRHYSIADLVELYRFDPKPIDTATERPQQPRDMLLRELVYEQFPQAIVSYHEQDTLFVDQLDEHLTEEETRVAWAEYERDRVRNRTNSIEVAVRSGNWAVVIKELGLTRDSLPMLLSRKAEFDAVMRSNNELAVRVGVAIGSGHHIWTGLLALEEITTASVNRSLDDGLRELESCLLKLQQREAQLQIQQQLNQQEHLLPALAGSHFPNFY